MTSKSRRRKTELRALKSTAKQKAFLVAFRATCNLNASARAVGVDRTLHFYWKRTNKVYEKAFEDSLDEARSGITDDMVHLARVGAFEPHYYKDQECFARRKRTQCALADGTTAFEDELPKKHPPIVGRKTVLTADGPQLGTYRREAGLLAMLAKAWIPEFANTGPIGPDNAEPPPFIVNRREPRIQP
jgi:hypothetical protein